MADPEEMTFPLLKPTEIVSCSMELGVPIRLEDIKITESTVIESIFESYLEIFLGTRIDNLKQRQVASTLN